MTAGPGLDPFALPSETRLRLGLLVAALLTVAWFWGVATTFESGPAIAACQQKAWSAEPVVATREALESWQAVFGKCSAPVLRASALRALASLALPFPAVYISLSHWRITRRKHVRLTPEMAPAAVAVITETARSLGIDQPPELYFDGRRNAVAQAFGRSRTPMLALSASVLDGLSNKRQRSVAILRHELAHIFHRDIRLYYMSLALFWTAAVTYTVTTAVIAIMALLSGAGAGVVLGIGWRYVLLIAFSYLVLRDFLRAREHYADLRAARWLGTAEMIEALPAIEGRDGQRAMLARAGSALGALLRPHPLAWQRREVIERPLEMMRFGAWRALFTGAAGGMLMPTIGHLVGMAGAGTWVGLHSAEIGGAAGGVFLGAVLAIGVWRNTHIRILGTTRVPRWPVVAAAASAGLLVGGLLPIHLVLDGGGPALPFTWPIVVCVVGASAAFCAWLASCAQLNLRTQTRQAGSRHYTAGVGSAAAVAALVMSTVHGVSARVRSSRMTGDGYPTPSGLDTDGSSILVSYLADRVPVLILVGLLSAATLCGCWWSSRDASAAAASNRPDIDNLDDVLDHYLRKRGRESIALTVIVVAVWLLHQYAWRGGRAIDPRPGVADGDSQRALAQITTTGQQPAAGVEPRPLADARPAERPVQDNDAADDLPATPRTEGPPRALAGWPLISAVLALVAVVLTISLGWTPALLVVLPAVSISLVVTFADARGRPAPTLLVVGAYAAVSAALANAATGGHGDTVARCVLFAVGAGAGWYLFRNAMSGVNMHAVTLALASLAWFGAGWLWAAALAGAIIATAFALIFDLTKNYHVPPWKSGFEIGLTATSLLAAVIAGP